jgi:uncharacterized protein YifN (PemK superfamily)
VRRRDHAPWWRQRDCINPRRSEFHPHHSKWQHTDSSQDVSRNHLYRFTDEWASAYGFQPLCSRKPL